MITNLVRGDVFDRQDVHTLAFAVNPEANDAGLAERIIKATGWNDLREPWSGYIPLGEYRVRDGDWPHLGNIHRVVALCCHTLNRDGWTNTPDYLEGMLYRYRDDNWTEHQLYASPGMAAVPLDIVMIGGGPIGRMMRGADPLANLGAIARVHGLAARVWYL